MPLSLREKNELLKQGILRGYLIPELERRDYSVSDWKRPVSLEDLVLRDEGWVPIYTSFTTRETYVRGHPLYLFFNTFYGDVHERSYKYCFVEYILNVTNFNLKDSLVGIFTRLNLQGGGHLWKNRVSINLDVPETAVNEIDGIYDEMVLSLSRQGVFEEITKIKETTAK